MNQTDPVPTAAFCDRCGAPARGARRYCGSCGNCLILDDTAVPDAPAAALDAGRTSPDAPLAGPPSPATSGAPPIDLWSYHDLHARIGVRSADGGAHLRGDDHHLVVVDGEPALGPSEVEHARIPGVVQLFGVRSTSQGTGSLGMVLDGGGLALVTNERLVVTLTQGRSDLGPVAADEVHTFVHPWDLVTSIAIPARRSLADRVSGARSIRVFDAMTAMILQIMPANVVLLDGEDERKMKDDDVFRLLIDIAVEHRLGVSPPTDHARLRSLQRGELERADGDLTAWLTDPHVDGVPPHLEGRLVERGVD